MKANIYLYFLLLIMALAVSCDDDESKPQALATFTPAGTTVKVGEELQFTNTSENATAFRWSFGDGTTSKEVSPKKAYTSSGVFLVTLVSTGSGGSTIANQAITVIPNASFVVENETGLHALTPVQFTNTSLGATSYEWSFGYPPNPASQAASPSLMYGAAGKYTVTLKAKSQFGESTFTKEITLNAATPALYYIEYGNPGIWQTNLDDPASAFNIADLTDKVGVGLAYDVTNKKIYFSDHLVTGDGKIWRMNIDGTGLEAIVTGLADPYGIALDVDAGKIYWTNEVAVDDESYVSRANLDGSNIENLVVIPGTQFRAVALDPENNKMYFYDYWYEELHAADLNGTNASVIISGVYGFGIAVDTKNDKIYFDDQNDVQLKMADLDGGNVTVVDDTDTRIYGIVVDEENDILYWSGRDSGEIYKANLDGSNQEVLKSTLASPRGIFLRK